MAPAVGVELPQSEGFRRGNFIEVILATGVSISQYIMPYNIFHV